MWWIHPLDALRCPEYVLRAMKEGEWMLYGATGPLDAEILRPFKFVAVLPGELPSIRDVSFVVITLPSILEDGSLRDMGFTLPADSITMKQAASAMKKGAVGVVVRPSLASRLKRTFGKRLLLFAHGSGGEEPVDYWIEM